jgi:putative endonuclease
VSWLVYILECSDRSLYVGVTNDLEKRVAAHESGKGARYTRGRSPLVVRHVEEAPSRAAAQKREAAIRRLSRRQKLALIERHRSCDR